VITIIEITASLNVRIISLMTALIPDQEPTPDFDERCKRVLNRWERGELPFKQAIELMNELEREAVNSGLPCNQGRVELLLGVMQGYRANLDASVRHFERARNLFEKAGNRKRAVGALLNLGESYRLKGDFTRARQFFHTAYEAAEVMGAKITQANAACNEGLIFLSMERFDAARAMLNKAAHLAEQVTGEEESPLPLLCEIYHGLVSVNLRLEDLEAAWSYALQSHHIAQQVGQPLLLGFANRAMGEALAALLNVPRSAEDTVVYPVTDKDPDDYFRAASEAFQEIKAEGELARTMYAQAISLMGRGRSMMAARKLQQAMIIFTRLGMSDDAAKAAHAQMAALANTGG
jgi:tetratricopeptide (TPR) repeat protein